MDEFIDYKLSTVDYAFLWRVKSTFMKHFMDEKKDWKFNTATQGRMRMQKCLLNEMIVMI